MARKPKPTPEEHAEFGARLAAVHHELGQIIGHVVYCYASATPQVRELVKASHALQRARDALDVALWSENPGR